jgi:hypothetical protein
MQYALLFYNPPDALTSKPPAEREAWFKDMMAWRGELQSAGVFRTGLRLATVDTATSVRRQGRDVLVTDGPFAETKEVLGGFFLIDCADLDEALAWARKSPIVRIGTVEVRPEFETPR